MARLSFGMFKRILAAAAMAMVEVIVESMAIVVMTAALATAIMEEMVKGKAMVALVLLVEETAG